ncbi:hypothetical protein H5410_037407 [Solanum commersonii]|uniref:Uncharacterized protein n=1 Tax=Solanum commersonii TaxID=4109 RepID=A0A9J5Y8E2_SOLCO|nr:hypothetical protein H5410_037407 [Solanum commersonii]
MHLSSWFVCRRKIRSVHYLILTEKFVFTVSPSTFVAAAVDIVSPDASPQPPPTSPMLHLPRLFKNSMSVCRILQHLCNFGEFDTGVASKVKSPHNSVFAMLLELFKNVNGCMSDSLKLVYFNFGECNMVAAS